MEQKKFCGKCGVILGEGQKFCATCGTAVDDFTAVAQPVSQPAPQPILQPIAPQPIVTPTGVVASEPIKSKKSKKPLIIGAVAAVVVLVLAVSAVALIGALRPKTRTIMMYLVGSNLESQSSAASMDIVEMMDSGFDEEYAKVVLYTGGANDWGLPEISAEENAIFEITNGELKKVQTYDQKSMVDGGTLTEFIDYAYQNYQSDLYQLVLWDHGGGPLIGFGQDEVADNNEAMEMKALGDALGQTKLVRDGKKFEMIGFDACLMGSIEIAATLKDFSNYMVASEESEPGYGWNYAYLGTITGETKMNELGTTLVDKYFEHYVDYPYDVDLSLSVVDLREVGKLVDKTDALFNGVESDISAGTFSDYSRVMTRDRVYGYTGRNSESFDLVDLTDLTESLAEMYPNEVEQLTAQIEKAVIYNRSNMSNTNGISVYFPNHNKQHVNEMLLLYKDVAWSEGYYNFLKKYGNFISGDKLVKKTVYDDAPTIADENGGVTTTLPQELVDNYQSAEIIVFRKLGENKFSPVYRSSEVIKEGNILRSTSANLQMVVKMTDGKTGEVSYGWMAAYEKERTAEYADYSTFGVLIPHTESGFSMKSYEMYMRFEGDETTARIRDIRESSSSDMASRTSYTLDEIDVIEFAVGTYKLFDENGVQNDSFESWGQLYGSGLTLEDGDTFELMRVDLDFDFGDMYEGEIPASALKDYYAEFIVYDTQGNSHRLSLVHIN